MHCYGCLCLLNTATPLAVPVCTDCWGKLSPDARAIIASNYDLRQAIIEQGVSADGATQILRAAKAMERAARSMAAMEELARVFRNRLWIAEGEEEP